MKQFTVRIPITGYVEVSVDADDIDAAIDKAFDVATIDNIEEWDLHRTVTEGNVCHAMLNKIEIYED